MAKETKVVKLFNGLTPADFYNNTSIHVHGLFAKGEGG